MSAYLFVHFTGEHENGEQIYFSLSRDGLHYEDFHQGEPFLTSGIGEKGVRDPFILRGENDDGFFIIGTDLRMASHHDWGKAQYQGSRNLVVYRSKDLVHWTDAALVETGIPQAGCVWAPEAVYDREKAAYMVYFASMVKEENDAEAKQRIYAVYTKDFQTFTKAEKYMERENHVIDTTMIYENGCYYRFSKDETTKKIIFDKAKHLHGDFTPVESETLDALAGVEGPAIFKFSDRNEWCLMVDRYATNGGYLPLFTNDLNSGDFRIADESEYDMGKSKKRHGSVLVITDEEYERLKSVQAAQ